MIRSDNLPALKCYSKLGMSMNNTEKTKTNNLRKISVIGLGYVGLPVAVAFGQKQRVVGFDINPHRIRELQQGIDVTGEVTSDILSKTDLLLTYNVTDIKQADFHIIAVPSPINQAKQPDFGCLIGASSIVGAQLKKGDIVVYESTVYPGATEERCIPVLEKVSGLKSNKDFFVGYSPERINPGDKTRTFTSIKKIVAAQNTETLDIVADVYASVVEPGVHKVSSIMVAEAAKVIENTQRDINIALINECALIFNKLGLDTEEVLNAAGTKWNFLPFRPGLVGGHCIGVDPYYLTHKAIECGVHPEVILAGRRINDNMGKYIAEKTIKQMSRLGKRIKDAKVGILGLTFKENCPDVRNSQVINIVRELQSYSIQTIVHDPLANQHHVQQEYNINLAPWESFENLDAIILAVAHNHFKEINDAEYSHRLAEPKLLVDVKSVLNPKVFAQQNIQIWRL